MRTWQYLWKILMILGLDRRLDWLFLMCLLLCLGICCPSMRLEANLKTFRDRCWIDEARIGWMLIVTATKIEKRLILIPPKKQPSFFSECSDKSKVNCQHKFLLGFPYQNQLVPSLPKKSSNEFQLISSIRVDFILFSYK